MKRTLTLRRETLGDLTRDELAAVHGGAEIPTTNAVICPIIGATQLRCALSLTTCIATCKD